ncbi:HAD family hydrolase [Pseudonocardia sp. WMMC193]|nr:HAD family hydrolase [Pseudonocardia sp. WMMC193]MCF7547593.1 HAD family hydrolase [Pseudonocardia sp. WMMC193]
MVERIDTVVLDVDGTLVDTNYQHALSWYRAFLRFDVVLPVWRLHRAIGMGGDQIVPAVAGSRFEQEHGDDVRAAWAEEFEAQLPEIRAFDGVRDLLTALRGTGVRVVLASSGAPEHVDVYLDLFDGRDLADAWTTSKDVDRTKPEPDLLHAAVERVDGRRAMMVGDSVWDFVAAGRAGWPGLGVRTGGFSAGELREAGAREVYDSLPELQEGLVRELRG